MVPVALGTQTKGSVLRPASYCGVTGFKASYGLLPMEGVLPPPRRAWTRWGSSRIHQLIWSCSGSRWDISLKGQRILRWERPSPCLRLRRQWPPPVQNALSMLRSAGASIRSVDIVAMLAKLSDAADTVTFYEGCSIPSAAL